MSTAQTRHPWNTGFTWQDHHGPFTTLSADQVQAFDRDGFFVVEDLLAPEVVAAVSAELDQEEAGAEAFLRSQEGGRFTIAEAGAISFVPHVAARHDVLRRTAADPRILGICADLIGPDVNLYWDQAVYKKPDKPRRFPWHQDNGYTFVEPQAYLTVWVALTDASVENGCPQVTPGVHRGGTLHHTYVQPLGWECFAEPAGVIAAPVRAGGAVVFSSLTPHLTGPNTSESVRKAYILQYAPAGAVALRGDPTSGGPISREPQDDPKSQFAVLRDGRPCVQELQP